MGLDMYLSMNVSLCNLEETPQSTALRTAVQSVYEGLYEPDNHFIGSSVTVPLAYWRKANAVHNWFVTHAQEGRDECQRTYITLDQLKELREACSIVLADHDRARELLPVRGGFFFGGTEYDQYYFQWVKYTVEALDRIIAKLPERSTVYYQSSW